MSLPPGYHQLESAVSHDLKAKPHDLQSVYKELQQGTICDTEKGRAETLQHMNDDLHRQGLIPHLELVQDSKTATGFSSKALTDPKETTSPVPGNEHLGLIKSALELDHVPITRQNISDVNKVINGESSWRPISHDSTDINAIEHHPSEGLMQEIPTTFREFALPGYNRSVNDPLSNVTSGIRNIIDTYGSLNNAPGIVSERFGGPYVGYD